MKAQLKKLLADEQPVTLTLLARRIAEQKEETCTQKLQRKVADALTDIAYCDPLGRQHSPYYWTDMEHSLGYDGFRTNTDRTITDVPFIEIMNAMRTVVDQNVAIPSDALIKHTAKVLGFSRMGAKIQEAMEQSLQALLRLGIVEDSDGSVKMVEG